MRSELWCNAACNKRARTHTGEEEHLIHLAPSCVPVVNTSSTYPASIQNISAVDIQQGSVRRGGQEWVEGGTVLCGSDWARLPDDSAAFSDRGYASDVQTSDVGVRTPPAVDGGASDIEG